MRLLKISINLFILLAFGLPVFFIPSLIGSAQSEQGWSLPVNLSNSGATDNPSMVIDQNGVIHVIWVDEIDGYKYVKSSDGVTWTAPEIVDYPFDSKANPLPRFIANINGTIGILWRDKDDALNYSQSLPSDLNDPSSWVNDRMVAKSALDFDVVVDGDATLHVVYVNGVNDENNNAPPGIYHIKFGTTGWSTPVNLYLSQYFRTLKPENAHVRIAYSEQENNNVLYVTWDDRPRKRIFSSRSLDGGITWSESMQIKGPEESAGIDFPYNIESTVYGNNVLMIWQMGQPGGRCTQFSQWSSDGGINFGEPIRVLDEFAACPQKSDPVFQAEDLSILSLFDQNDISLIAWNGSNWSNSQMQSDLSTFFNPVTFDSVLLGCQMVSSYKEDLYFVGCDEGIGGDIWFSSRPLGAIDTWFPPPSAWSTPVVITSVDKRVSDLNLVADDKDRVHAFWVQSSFTNEEGIQPLIQYSQWNGENWSDPMAILAGVSGKPLQLTARVDGSGRILLVWADEGTGELFFSWANSDSAGRTSEWAAPVYVPTNFLPNSSLDILSDASGKIVIGYAVPINEHRGVYFVTTSDVGKTWSQPLQIFDAVSTDWDMVDHPKMCLTGDGLLHVLFGRYAYLGDQQQSHGLYYSQSGNGGVAWSDPDIVTEQPVSWSSIYCTGEQTIHRLWQETKQSKLVTYHQVSQDGGLTWGILMTISSVSGDHTLIESTMDRAGYPHFFQLTSKDDMILIDHQKWDGSHWNILESKEVGINKFGIPSSLETTIALGGNLLVSTVVDYTYPATELKNELIGFGRFLGLPNETQPPVPLLMATAEPTGVQAEEIPGSIFTPTIPSPLTSFGDPISNLPRWRNIVGILLIGGILIMTLIVVRPRGKNKKPKK